MSQAFKIVLLLETECEETFTEEHVKSWVEEQFDGCDVGQVQVTKVEEQE